MGYKRDGRKHCIVLLASLILLLVFMVIPAAANPKDHWEQCANRNAPTCEGSGNDGWVTGKVGTNNGQYGIGDFIAYRAYWTGLVPGMRYCSGAWWDVAKAELPAIDYLGTYTLTVSAANALYNTGIPGGTIPTTAAIPGDPILAGSYVLNGFPFAGSLPYGSVGDPGAQGWFTLWGGDDLLLKGYALTNPPADPELTNGSQSIEYCFTAVLDEAVLAWSGHIADPDEWSALDRPSGSPYHMKNGTQSGFYTPPRASVNDFVEFDPNQCDDVSPCPSANHYTLGSQDLQLGVEEPTAITLNIIGARGADSSLVLALVGMVTASFATALLIVQWRRQKRSSSRP